MKIIKSIIWRIATGTFFATWCIFAWISVCHGGEGIIIFVSLNAFAVCGISIVEIFRLEKK